MAHLKATERSEPTRKEEKRSIEGPNDEPRSLRPFLPVNPPEDAKIHQFEYAVEDWYRPCWSRAVNEGESVQIKERGRKDAL
jgi:hypothetical protein